MSRRREQPSAPTASVADASVAEPTIVAPPVKRPWQLAVSSALLSAWILFLAAMAWG